MGTDEGDTADDRRWQELLSTPESEEVLERMAAEAWAEYEAGQTIDLDAWLDVPAAPGDPFRG